MQNCPATDQRHLRQLAASEEVSEDSDDMQRRRNNRRKMLKPTQRIFGTSYDEGPPPCIHFKKGQALQLRGGYDLDMGPLRDFGDQIKQFYEDQKTALVNELRKRTT